MATLMPLHLKRRPSRCLRLIGLGLRLVEQPPLQLLLVAELLAAAAKELVPRPGQLLAEDLDFLGEFVVMIF